MLFHKSSWIRKRGNNVILVSFGENTTGTYQFQTEFYGLTDMLAEFQKAIDLKLINCKNTYKCLDDILIITKGSVEKHKETLENVFHRLDEGNFATSLDKCMAACKQIKWLGFRRNYPSFDENRRD